MTQEEQLQLVLDGHRNGVYRTGSENADKDLYDVLKLIQRYQLALLMLTHEDVTHSPRAAIRVAKTALNLK